MQGEAQNLPTALNTKKDMFHLDDKISFTGGFLLTMATSISMVGILQAAAEPTEQALTWHERNQWYGNGEDQGTDAAREASNGDAETGAKA